MMPTRPTFFTASIAAWVSRSIAAQSGLATNLRATATSSGEYPEVKFGSMRSNDGDIALGREAVADAADVVVDAENFLDHHHRALRRASGIGTVGAELNMIRSRRLMSCPTGSSIGLR